MPSMMVLGVFEGFFAFHAATVENPGPITKRLTDAYIAEVGCDFVKQYLDRLS
jgi:hypothetical protein